MTSHLVTASATSRLSNLTGRAIVTVRGHHFIIDSPPPLGGPNEEINPIDALLSALATCGTFVFETAAQELGIRLYSVAVTAAGEFDPRGVCGEPFDPRVQSFRVRVDLSGPTQNQAEALIGAFKSRCPVYTTLVRAAPIDIEVALTAHKLQEAKMKRLRCRDAGFDCNHEIQAETEEEVLQQAAEHVQSVHGLEVTPELVDQVKKLIQEQDS